MHGQKNIKLHTFSFFRKMFNRKALQRNLIFKIFHPDRIRLLQVETYVFCFVCLIALNINITVKWRWLCLIILFCNSVMPEFLTDFGTLPKLTLLIRISWAGCYSNVLYRLFWGKSFDPRPRSTWQRIFQDSFRRSSLKLALTPWNKTLPPFRKCLPTYHSRSFHSSQSCITCAI
jgi:hypothetical protein